MMVAAREAAVARAEHAESALRVHDLHVTFSSEAGPVRAVRGVSYDLARGRTLGIVGESGSGKSVSALAIMGLLPDTAAVRDSVLLNGRELVGTRRAEHAVRCFTDGCSDCADDNGVPHSKSPSRSASASPTSSVLPSNR